MKNKTLKFISIVLAITFLWQESGMANNYFLRPQAINERKEQTEERWAKTEKGIYGDNPFDVPVHISPKYITIPKDYTPMVAVTARLKKGDFGRPDDWDDASMGGELWERIIPEVQYKCCKPIAVNLGFDKIPVPRRLFGSLDITDDRFRNAPIEPNLAWVAVWIAKHMADNWFHTQEGLEGGYIDVEATFGKCKIAGIDSLYMVFKDTGPGIPNIKDIFDRSRIRRWINANRHDGWGTKLTQALLLGYRIGNIRVASKGKCVTYFVDGSEKVEKGSVKKGTEITIVIFPPLLPRSNSPRSVAEILLKNSVRNGLQSTI